VFTIHDAKIVARVAHAGQVDKAGRPYIEHPLRVAANFERLPYAVGRRSFVVVALLHDVVEDTRVTLADLRELGVSPRWLDAVDALTHRPGEPRETYYARVRSDALARAVKRADIADNADPARLRLLNAEDRERLTEKYRRAAEMLTCSESDRG